MTWSFPPSFRNYARGTLGPKNATIYKEQFATHFDSCTDLPGMPYIGVHSGTLTADVYCLTAAGIAWLKTAPSSYFPTAAGRYAQALRNYQGKFGDGFLQRAHEAAKCYQSAAWLACCAMCGAAAESALLAVAIRKVGNDQPAMRKYSDRDGRREIARLIFETATTQLRNQFDAAFNILSYWRDDAAHGRASTISELEAYDAFGRLLRLAAFASDNWDA